MDAALIANEVIDCRLRGTNCYFEKAYDRVYWNYLLNVLKDMWLGKNGLVGSLFCVSTVKFSVLVSWFSRRFFTLGRGLRQGVPLSPFLFLIARGGLVQMIKCKEECWVERLLCG